MSTYSGTFNGAPLYCKRSSTKVPTFVPRVKNLAYVQIAERHLVTPEVVRDQQLFGSCVGQATGFAVSDRDHIASGAFLWVEGRRVDLDLAGVDDGTCFASVFSVIENTGVAPYDPRESDPTPENWDHARLGPHLAATMAAADRKLKLKVTSIDPCAHDAFLRVCAAIASKARVVFSSGLKKPFFDLEPEDVATSTHLGGESNGHAQAFCGFDLATQELFALNSWGRFAGLFLSKADYPQAPAWPIPAIDRGHSWELPGAYRMAASALSELWEIYVIEVLK